MNRVAIPDSDMQSLFKALVVNFFTYSKPEPESLDSSCGLTLIGDLNNGNHTYHKRLSWCPMVVPAANEGFTVCNVLLLHVLRIFSQELTGSQTPDGQYSHGYTREVHKSGL